MSQVITTQSETTTSLFSTPTSTPLTSNSSSSSSTLQKSKQKSLGKRLWVVGRGNNNRQKKTRLFLLDENGCQRKYSSEDAAMQRLWRPNSIAIGDDNIKKYSVKNERGKRRKRILLRIGTLASLVAVGSCFLLLLWVFLFWHNDESFKSTQSQKNTNSSLSSILPLTSPPTTNIFDNTSLIQTTTLKTKINSFLPSSTNNYFISSSSPKISTIINNKIYSTTFQTPRPQELKFSIMLLNTNSNEKKILDNSPKIIQIHHNIVNRNKINSPINISAKSFVEFDRFENSQNIPNETIKAILENGNKLGTISTTTERIETSTTTTTSTTLKTTKNLIQTSTFKTTIKSNNTKLSSNYYLPSTENSITKIEGDIVNTCFRVNQKTSKKYEKMAIKSGNDNYNQKRPTINFAPVKAENEQIVKKDEKENTKKQQIVYHTTTQQTINNDFSLQEELNEIISSVERSGEINNLKRPFEPVEIPFEPLPPSISEIPIWKRPPPGENLNNLNLPPPPPPPPLPPLPIKFSLQANVKPASNIERENNEENNLLRRKRREAPILVTALIDIGRGNWQRFTRHFDQYLNYLTNILFRIQNNIIIYCDNSVYEYLKIIQISLSELPFYKYRKEIEEIMNWEQKNWREEWDEQMKTHPETLYPDYDILVNSKPYFLYNATQISQFPKPFEEEQLFVWLDAGYGHGSQSAIPLGIWKPTQINYEQITLIKLPTNGERVERYTIERVYRKHRSVISGGFLAGGEKVIRRFWTFFMKTFLELLDQHFVDDDQTTLLITIQRYNSTFNLLKGNWFDAFKLLPSTN
uniref:Uncharacterized protein n=4 Tax=Meloidogyne TaxID=189290 RepID=A0A915PAS7_9BILA